MLLALVLLIQRKLPWTLWMRNNGWIVAFFVYCGISIIWSDFPIVGLKRWIRALGAILMILVALSEVNPVAAIATVVRRCALILVPLSIILIKYYREIGVGYNFWTGEEQLIGATTDKNALGRLCLVAGLFLFWEVVTFRKNSHGTLSMTCRLIVASILIGTLWLLNASDSATSLVSFIFGSIVVFVLRISVVRRYARSLAVLMATLSPFVVFLVVFTNLEESLVTSLGRDLTLTDRTVVWGELLRMNTNALMGVGYDTFWLGDRLGYFVQNSLVNSAHNGYLEMYLELGWCGLLLFAGMVISVFVKATHTLQMDAAYGMLRLAVLSIFLVYNFTESAYKLTGLVAFVLLLVAIQVPASQQPKRARPRIVPEGSCEVTRARDSRHRMPLGARFRVKV
jgi:O-antigen ligase